MTTQVDLTPVWQAVITLGGTLLTALGSILLQKLIKKYNLENASAIQDNWDQALHNAITYAAQVSSASIKAKGWDHVEVHNDILARAAVYLVGHVPDAVK